MDSGVLKTEEKKKFLKDISTPWKNQQTQN